MILHPTESFAEMDPFELHLKESTKMIFLLIWKNTLFLPRPALATLSSSTVFKA